MSPLKLNLSRNSLWAAAEVVVTGFSLFLLYKFVVVNVGVSGLGLWSLVLATTSLARLGDIGTASGLSRFAAIAQGQGDSRMLACYVDTALLTNSTLYCLISGLVIWPLYHLIAFIVPPEKLAEARSLLPYAVGSFLLMNISSAVLASLIGVQRSDVKSKIVVISVAVQVSIVYLLVAQYGLLAMAWGQIGQYLCTLILGRWTLIRVSPGGGLRLLPIQFNVLALRELVGFGVKLQATTLISFAFEPLMKLAISSMAGLEVLGIFEMAYRMVLQVRNVIAAPLQTLVPAFAYLDKANSEEWRSLYLRALSITAFTSSTLLGTLCIFSPLISFLWLGRINSNFVVFTLLCSFGWWLNVLSSPAYLAAVSRGFLRGNIAGHVVSSFGGSSIVYALSFIVNNEFLAVSIPLMGLGGGALVAGFINSRQLELPLLPPAATIAEEICAIRTRAATVIAAFFKRS